MRIITLNTWGGAAGIDELLDFFKKYQDVDVFCLQEIFNGDGAFLKTEKERANGKTYDLLERLRSVVPEHDFLFSPQLKEDYGIAIFWKKRLHVVDFGEYFVHKFKGFIPDDNLGFHARNLNYITIEHEGKPVTIVNIHALWNKEGKTDTDERLSQSQKIVERLAQISGDIVLSGDFNLGIDTESLRIIERSGLRNLIKEFGISSTRSSLYMRDEKFADYTFVSPGVEIKKFEVLPDTISDHAPLYLEI